MSDQDHQNTEGDGELIGVVDLDQFWSAARSAMLTLSLCVAAFKVGLTLIWCSFSGIDISLEFWWHLIPYFELGLDQPSFIRAVTMSSWLGAVGMLVGFVIVAVSGHRADRRLTDRRLADLTVEPDATRPDDHETVELAGWVSFVTGAHRTGRRVGAWVGATSLLITVIFELIRDRVFGAYVLPSPHLFLITAAGIPPLTIVWMLFRGWFDRSVDFDDTFPLISRTHAEALASS